MLVNRLLEELRSIKTAMSQIELIVILDVVNISAVSHYVRGMESPLSAFDAIETSINVCNEYTAYILYLDLSNFVAMTKPP